VGPCFQIAFSGAENEFSPDLLKDSFNCRDLSPHGVHPVFIRGERIENAFPAVALWRPRRYISGSKFPQNPTIPRVLDGAPVRLFHAGFDQELPDPEGAR
jgi:hypothetical protein